MSGTFAALKPTVSTPGAPARDYPQKIAALMDALDALFDTAGVFGGTLSAPNRPGFSASRGTEQSNVTGDGTTVDVICDTEAYDRTSNYNNTTGVFTAVAPGGLHDIGGELHIKGIAAGHTLLSAGLITSNRNYTIFYGDVHNSVNAGEIIFPFRFLVDMDAGDTAKIQVTVSGSTKVVDIGTGTRFSGYQLP